MTELKPCPFCGGKAEIERSLPTGFDGEEWYYIYCSRAKESRGNKCHANPVISKAGENAKERVIEAWNTRPNPWHTGTPTDEGWYLVAYECIHECKNKGKLEYHTMHIFENELGYKDIRGRASDDVWKAVAWQKITPYEEKENGHTD